MIRFVACIISVNTAGDADTLIAGHNLGQTDLDYQNAKAELKKEFGKPVVLARACIVCLQNASGCSNNICVSAII